MALSDEVSSWFSAKRFNKFKLSKAPLKTLCLQVLIVASESLITYLHQMRIMHVKQPIPTACALYVLYAGLNNSGFLDSPRLGK